VKIESNRPGCDTSLLERYRDQVSCRKRGAAREAVRIAFLLRDPLASVRLVDLSSSDFSAWRDRRLRVGLSGVCSAGLDVVKSCSDGSYQGVGSAERKSFNRLPKNPEKSHLSRFFSDSVSENLYKTICCLWHYAT
jgi:hypothetical protein